MIGKVTVFTHVITLTAVSMPDHMKCALSEFGNGSSVSFTYYTKKTLQSKGRGPNKQYLIKWLHWPSKFNSWVSTNDVKAYV